MSVYIEQNGFSTNFSNDSSWVILSPLERSIKEKIEQAGTPLKEWDINIYRGVLTGYNDAFVISGDKRNELIAADPKSAEIIRPILRGRDIKRYGYNFADLWLIATFPSMNYDIDNYPAIKKHLLSYGIHRLEQTGKTYTIGDEIIKARKKTHNQWFETQDSISYWDDFSKQKIVWKRIGSLLRFAYDENACMSLDSTCFATGNHIKYLTAVLNTYIGNYLFKDSPQTGTGDLIVSVQAFEPIKIPIPTPSQENEIINIFDNINNAPNDSSEAWDMKLEEYVSQLFGFTKEEHDFIISISSKLFRPQIK